MHVFNVCNRAGFTGRILLLITGCLFFSLPARAQTFDTAVTSSESLTFDAFLRKVTAYYPGLKAAHIDVEAALARDMQARAGFWPSLDFSAGYKVSDDPVNVFGMLLRQERFTASDFDLKRLNRPARHQDFSAGVQAELPLWDAMQTIYRTRSAAAQWQASGSAEAFTRMEALLVAQDAYVNALTLERLAVVAEEVLQSSLADIQKAKDLKERGMILGADYYAARVMLGEFMRTRHELARQKQAMAVLLNVLMGDDGSRAWVLTSSVEAMAAPDADSRDLTAAVLSRRPDILALNSRLEAADLDLRRERATVWPRLGAFGGAAHDRDRIDGAGGNNYTVGVKADIPLFDPARSGRVKEAQSRRDRLEIMVRLTEDRVRRDVAEERARYDTLQDNREVLQGMVEDAGEAVKLVGPLYNEGRKSIANVLEMRRTYWLAVQAYEKAQAGLRLSWGRLLFLTGALNEDNVTSLKEARR